ncbi:MAG: ACT domain-containing protein [Oscillospiraceae bacterium]|nr:ACT domain-containing protein [Oscillospiraceae bacterium]
MEGWAVSSVPKYFIVEADAMPEIFRKVAQAKSLLETGAESTINGAARAAGISRSAYYKYKDAVRPFQDMLHGRIVTFQILLKDEPGALSGVLNVFSGCGSNILTINQSIPSSGCAVVTASAETSALDLTLDRLLDDVRAFPSVLKCEILAG